MPSAGLTFRPVLMIAAATLALAVAATVVLTRGDKQREQQEALTATTTAALATNTTLDDWAATTARTPAFQRPPDGTTRTLYTTWHTTTTRTTAVDITLTNARSLCLISTAAQSTPNTPSSITHTWHQQPCRTAIQDSNPAPTPLRPTPKP